MDIEVAVKVLAVGFPALLIILGWISYMSGSGLETISGIIRPVVGEEVRTGEDLKSFGTGLIFVGVVVYLLELAFYLFYTYYES